MHSDRWPTIRAVRGGKYELHPFTGTSFTPKRPYGCPGVAGTVGVTLRVEFDTKPSTISGHGLGCQRSISPPARGMRGVSERPVTTQFGSRSVRGPFTGDCKSVVGRCGLLRGGERTRPDPRLSPNERFTSARRSRAQAARRPAPSVDRPPPGTRCVDRYHATGPQRIHPLGGGRQAG